MKILQMISKNDRYGAQRIFLDQVATLKARGHQVTVAVRGTEGFVTDSVHSMGVPCFGMPMKGFADIRMLRRLVRDEKIDVIHSVLDRADYLGLLLSRITRRPVVSTMMVPRCHIGYRFMNRVIALADKQTPLLVKGGVSSSCISVIRPGIDVARFSSPDPGKREAWRKKLDAGRYDTVFCHISSMLIRKAHGVSLEIVSECRKRGLNPLLVIIGDPVEGEYYESLLKRSSELGIRTNIFFTGWTADVPEILSLSHFTVLPSENEALGVVLMEGMAAGTPVIAREGEGGAELITEYGCGFLYRPSEGVGGLADRIVSVRKDSVRFGALTDRCRSVATDDFSLERFGERLEAVYAQVVKR